MRRTVKVWHGASPHGDLEETVLEVDEEGFIRSVGGNDIGWGGGPVSINDPLPNRFPLTNIYKTKGEALRAAIETYQGRIIEAAAALGRLTGNARDPQS